MVETEREEIPAPPQMGIRPTPDDWKILMALCKKLGVDKTQIFRLAIRALAAKEGVAA